MIHPDECMEMMISCLYYVFLAGIYDLEEITAYFLRSAQTLLVQARFLGNLVRNIVMLWGACKLISKLMIFHIIQSKMLGCMPSSYGFLKLNCDASFKKGNGFGADRIAVRVCRGELVEYLRKELLAVLQDIMISVVSLFNNCSLQWIKKRG